MEQKLYDWLAEIEQLIKDYQEDQDRRGLKRILNICENAQLERKMEKKLKECNEWADWVVIPHGKHSDDGSFVCHKHVFLDDAIGEVMKFDGAITCEWGKRK